MIPCTDTCIKPEITSSDNWQQELSTSFTQIQHFLEYLDLGEYYDKVQEQACKQFPFRVTRHFASLMQRGDPQDPLLMQVLPTAAELQSRPGFTLDPLLDQPAHRGGGVLQKYHGRALLISTPACAINCRYCFRRHFPYSDHHASRDHWSAAIDSLAASPDIHEVILSGGDPLSLSNSKLLELFDQLQTIPHIKRLRIHTRLPVVLPSRINAELLQILNTLKWPTSMVIHVNHAHELSPELGLILADLRHANITLLNQSVLLKNINDSVHQQVKLCEKLYLYNVLPYYLHILDKVVGASHFEVSQPIAKKIHLSMAKLLPGYLLPRLVVEKPGADGKIVL